MSRPVKHSLTLNGHRTSVSLENEFWRAFCKRAEDLGQPINALAAEIDAARGAETAATPPKEGVEVAHQLWENPLVLR